LKSGFAEGPNKFTIITSGHDITLLQIGFDGPSQPECKLVTNKNKNVDVTYTTKVAGDYKIHIRYQDKNIPGSPFKTKILGDAKASVSKVKISGAIKEAKINESNQIIVDAREAGLTGGLAAHMEGPSKAELTFRNEPDETVAVVFKPTVAGEYKVHLKFGMYHVPGSPLKIQAA